MIDDMLGGDDARRERIRAIARERQGVLDVLIPRLHRVAYEYLRLTGRNPTHLVLGREECQALRDLPYLSASPVRPDDLDRRSSERFLGMEVVEALRLAHFVAACEYEEES